METSTNMQLATAAASCLIQHGVREVVICAGARNTPLILTFLQTPGLHVWHHFEERSAGFFAIGRMQAGAGPVAVVTTSGTAVAELLPAVIESYYQGMPLFVCSADRPKRFRGSAAPQCIDQNHLFADYAERGGDVAVGEVWSGMPGWSRRRPLHLNLCFDEPLIDGPVGMPAVDVDGGLPEGLPAPVWRGFGCGPGERLLVVVGRLRKDERQPVARFLRGLGKEAWLEAESGLWGEEGVAEWRGDSLAGFSHVLRLGGVPCAGWWRELETMDAIRVLSWSGEGFSGLGRGRGVEAEAVDLARLELSGSDAGQVGDGGGVDSEVAEPADPEERVVWWMSRAVAKGASVFLGNSMPVRHWQKVGLRVAGREMVANRGANGIDGEVSSFLGMAVTACGEGREAWGLLGDLTVLYDCAAPYMTAQMPVGKVRLVVLNNGGGAIFTGLPFFLDLPEKARQCVRNQHAASFKHWAGMWGWEYRVISSPADFEDLPEGPVLLEWREGE